MKIKKYAILTLGIFLLNGCSSFSSTEVVSTIAGGALGGLAGDVATDGTNHKTKDRAVIGGTAIGMVTGNIAARLFSDKLEEKKLARNKKFDKKLANNLKEEKE